MKMYPTFYPAAILKGIIEHGDGTCYFGSLLAYSVYEQQAKDLLFIEVDGKTVTPFGRHHYKMSGLGDIVRKRGHRAYFWDWSTYVPTTTEHASTYSSIKQPE